MKSSTGDHMAHRYLVQRISLAVQRGNTAAVLGSTVFEGRGLVFWGGGGGRGCYFGGFLVTVYCFYYLNFYYCLLKANNKMYCIL